MDLALAGKKAIVSGASRGIGKAIATLLAEEGASLALCARGEEKLQEVADGLSATTKVLQPGPRRGRPRRAARLRRRERRRRSEVSTSWW